MLGFKKFLRDEEAVGVIELVLIIVILIAVVALFRSQLNNLITNLFTKIGIEAGKL